MGKNKGSRFVPRKALEPQEYNVVESCAAQVKHFHGVYDPDQKADVLITYAFLGAAGAISFFGEGKMPEISGGAQNRPCLLKAEFNQDGAWKVARIINPNEGETVDVVVDNISSERDVVRLMRSWVKQAESLCDAHHDIKGYQNQAKLVLQDSILPS